MGNQSSDKVQGKGLKPLTDGCGFSEFSYDENSDEHIILCARAEGVEENVAVELNSIIIARYLKVVSTKARMMKSARVDEEDLVSEGFLALLSAIRHFTPGKGQFSTFANTCINNRMKNVLVSAKNRPIKCDDFNFDLIADEMPTADELIIAREKNLEIMSQLSHILSKREYEVVSLYINAFSYKQISEKLGITTKAVDNALSRARQKLKEKYKSK